MIFRIPRFPVGSVHCNTNKKTLGTHERVILVVSWRRGGHEAYYGCAREDFSWISFLTFTLDRLGGGSHIGIWNWKRFTRIQTASIWYFIMQVCESCSALLYRLSSVMAYNRLGLSREKDLGILVLLWCAFFILLSLFVSVPFIRLSNSLQSSTYTIAVFDTYRNRSTY